MADDWDNTYYGYDDFNRAIWTIANQIIVSGYGFDIILAPLRGAAIPAVALSHKLEVPPRVFAFEGGREFDFNSDAAVRIKELIAANNNLLWIDDIVDSGDTLKEFFEVVPEAVGVVKTACLLWNKTSGIEPDFYADTTNRDTFPEYIDFWWEI